MLSSIELLFVRLHVDATLQLGAGSADLEAHNAIGDGLMELLQALNTGILHGMLQSSRKVRHKLTDRTVDDVSGSLIMKTTKQMTYPRWATAPDTP